MWRSAVENSLEVGRISKLLLSAHSFQHRASVQTSNFEGPGAPLFVQLFLFPVHRIVSKGARQQEWWPLVYVHLEDSIVLSPRFHLHS